MIYADDVSSTQSYVLILYWEGKPFLQCMEAGLLGLYHACE